MIAFGCSVTSRETFERLALPGIERAAEPDSLILDWESKGNPFQTYNAILDELSGRDDVEAVALIHQDLEITDPEFARKLRARLRDSSVAVVGNAGGRGVRSIAWWEGDALLGSWRWVYAEQGGGALDAAEWDTFVPEGRHGCHEVDAVDGMFHVLSPWAVRELRYDESVNAGGMHGCDVDLCFQAREAGKSVVVDEIEAVHHHGMTVLGDEPEEWVEAYVRFQRKWEGRLPELERNDVDWEQAARRAEAEAAAARVQRGELSLMRNESDKRLVEAIERIARLEVQLEATEREVAVRQAVIDSMLASRSWRLAAPLRRLTALVRPGRDDGRHDREG